MPTKMKKLYFLALMFLTPVILSAQISDSVINLPIIEIIDSSLKQVIPSTLLSRQIFELNPVADIGDILRAESNVGGVRRGGYAVDPVVRGYRYSQINVFLDHGIHIEGGCPNRMDPVMAHLEPEQIEKIEIVKGPYLMEYGSSPAASIRISTQKRLDQLATGQRLNLISGYESNRNAWRQSIHYSNYNGKLYYAVSGGIKTSGNYTDGNGIEWNSSFRKYSLSADAGYKTKAGNSFMLSWKGSFGRDVKFPVLPMDEIIDNAHIISGSYDWKSKLNHSKNINLSAYHSNVYHLMDNSFRPQSSQVVPPLTGIMQAEAGVHTYSTGMRAAFMNKYMGAEIESGVDLLHIVKDGTREMKMIMEMDGQQFINLKYTNLWNEAVIFNSGYFSKISFSKNKYTYSGTLRIDYNHSHSSDTITVKQDEIHLYTNSAVNRILPSLSSAISYNVTQSTSVGLAIAYSQRASDMQERYIKFLATGYDRFDYLGNPKLKPEINLQADILLKHKRENASVSLNLFVSQIQNYITGVLLPPSVARPQSLGAPGVKQFKNIDKAIFTGFESTASYTPNASSEITFSAGYTLAWYPSIDKIIIENNQIIETVTLTNDPVGEMPALEAELRYKYNSKKYNLKPEVLIRATAPQHRVSESYYEESTPGYMIADLSIGWSPYKFLTFTGGVRNILDKAYYDHLNRRLLNSSLKLYEPGRSFFVVLKFSI